MDKEVWYIITMVTTQKELLDSVLIRWTNLEPLYKVEASQKQTSHIKHIYMKSGKIVPRNLFGRQQWTETRLGGHSGEGNRRVGMSGEVNE